MKIVIRIFLGLVGLGIIVAGIAYQRGWWHKLFSQTAYVEEAKFKRIVRDLVHGKEVQSLAKKRDVARLHSRVEQIGDVVNDQKKVVSSLEKADTTVQTLQERVNALEKSKKLDSLPSDVQVIRGRIDALEKSTESLDTKRLKDRVDALEKNADARISILEAEAKKKIDLETELSAMSPHRGDDSYKENLVNDVEEKLNRVLKQIDLALTRTEAKIDKALNKHKKDVEAKFSSVKKDINRVRDQQEKVVEGARKLKKSYVKERVRRELADAVIKQHLSTD